MLLSFLNSLTSDSIVTDYCRTAAQAKRQENSASKANKAAGNLTENGKLIYGKAYCFLLPKSVGRVVKGIEAGQVPEVLSIPQNPWDGHNLSRMKSWCSSCSLIGAHQVALVQFSSSLCPGK